MFPTLTPQSPSFRERLSRIGRNIAMSSPTRSSRITTGTALRNIGNALNPFSQTVAQSGTPQQFDNQTVARQNMQAGRTIYGEPTQPGGQQAGLAGGSLLSGTGGQGGSPDPMTLLRESMEARRDSARRGGEQSFRDLGDTFQTGAQSLVERLRQGQRNINMGRQNVALDRMRSVDDLVRNIRQGVQSGGIQMAGAGILPGSAPQALARDFGQFGTQQRGQIMRDSGLAMRELDTEQEDLGRLRDIESEQLRRSKETETARIRNDLNDKLLAIEFEAREGGLSDFQARHLRDQIVNEGIQRLMQLDAQLKQRLGGIQPQDRRAVEAEAHRIARENQAPGGFDFTAPGVGMGGGQAPGLGMGAGLGVGPEELLARPGRLEDEF